MSIQINALKELSLRGSDYAKKTGPDRYDIYEQEAKPPLIPIIAFIKLKEKKVDKFDGSFGFDWLEYNVEQKKYTHVQGTPISSLEKYFDAESGKFITNLSEEQKIEKIKLDYEQLVEVKDMDYRMPYLSMKAGQTIKLTLDIQVLPYKKEEQDRESNALTIKAPENYELQVKDSLEGIKKDKKVTLAIHCKQASSTGTLIIKDKDEKVIGGLVMVDNTQTTTIHIRMVALLEKPSDAKDADSYARLMLSTIDVGKLEKYLNENSLNQANIQAVIEKENNKLPLYYLNFDATAAEWKDYMQKEDGTMKFKDKVDIEDTLITQLEQQYRKKYAAAEQQQAFNGVLLFVTKEEKLSRYTTGGESKPIPVDYNNIIIFGNRLTDNYAYAHELGHLLGLHHVFSKGKEEEEECEGLYSDYRKNKALYEKVIKNTRAKYYDETKVTPEDKEKMEDLEKELNSTITKINDKNTAPNELEALKKKVSNISNVRDELRIKYVDDKDIDQQRDKDAIEGCRKQLAIIQEVLQICTINKYKFTQGGTYNIMDYDDNNSKTKCLFNHIQWVMLKRNTAFTK